MAMLKLHVLHKLLFLCLLFVALSHSTEQVCEPNYEMQSKDINTQINWAKGEGCSHLKIITKTNTTIMNLSTGEEQIFENTVSTETKQAEESKTEKLKVSSLRENISRGYITLGYLYLSNGREIFLSDRRGVLEGKFTLFSWDAKSFWLDFFVNERTALSFERLFISMDPGIRVLYPFSKRNSTFYFGGGGGYSFKIEGDGRYHGFFTENAIGYFIKRSNEKPIQIEAFSTVLFHEEKAFGLGIRFLINNSFVSDIEKTAKAEEAKRKETAKTESKASKVSSILALVALVALTIIIID